MEFAIETAARRGSILNLQWSDVDLEFETVTLKNKKTRRSKSPETRTIPMPPRVKAILESLGDVPQTGYVFGGVTANQFRLQFRRAIKRADLHDFRFHDLRHVGATRLASVLDSDLLMLADMTGHTDVRMLRRDVSPRRSEIANRLKRAPSAVPDARQTKRQDAK